MCFYSNTDIRAAVIAGTLVIEPFRPDTHLQPGSYDLTLAGLYIHQGREFFSERYVLGLGGKILAGVTEYIHLDASTGLEVHGRSSVGRLFVVPHTAGWAENGWYGQLTLEIINHGDEPFPLVQGMRIAQAKFERSLSPADPIYAGKYQGQMGVVASRLHLDPELQPA